MRSQGKRCRTTALESLGVEIWVAGSASTSYEPAMIWIGYDPNIEQPRKWGIPSTESLADITQTRDVLLFSLPNSEVVETVIFGTDGVLANCHSGQIVIDLSTSNPTSTRRISVALAQHGVEYIDAGISGGARGAESGTLSIMVGGDEAALENVRWILDRFSSHIYYMGRSGSGHTTKLLNNFLNAVSLSATAEVMIAARMADLELHTVLDVLNHSTGVNFATLNRFPSILEGDYLEGGLTGNLTLKDVLLYCDLVRELGAPTMNGAGCLASFRVAAALGYGEQISNRIVDALGDLAGGIRLQGRRQVATAIVSFHRVTSKTVWAHARGLMIAMCPVEDPPAPAVVDRPARPRPARMPSRVAPKGSSG